MGYDEFEMKSNEKFIVQGGTRYKERSRLPEIKTRLYLYWQQFY